jgi:hemolysin activation/secretion protein
MSARREERVARLSAATRQSVSQQPGESRVDVDVDVDVDAHLSASARLWRSLESGPQRNAAGCFPKPVLVE